MPPNIFPLTVGTTAVRVFHPNPNRILIGMANTHTTAIVYYHKDRTRCNANEGFPLFPRATIVLQEDDGDDCTGELWMISDTASTGVRIQEDFKK